MGNDQSSMMKYTISLFLVAAVAVTFSAPIEEETTVALPGIPGVSATFTRYNRGYEVQAGKGALCGTCASLTGQAIQILLNYVLNAGIVGGCSKLCGQLSSKTERTVCDVACGIVRIKAFAAALKKADLDPIYFCDELGLCIHDDNGAGTLDAVTVSPDSAAQSTTFNGAMQVTVTNHTGVGEFRFEVSGGAQQPAGGGSIYPELAPGSYGVKISIDTTPSSDPTQGPQWMPGQYQLAGEFCMGECGSDHPHSKIFGKKAANFTITA